MAHKLVRATATKWHKILGYTGSNAIKQLPKYINGAKLTKCEAISPRCTVGSRQAEHESHRESMEEDDMVMR